MIGLIVAITRNNGKVNTEVAEVELDEWVPNEDRFPDSVVGVCVDCGETVWEHERYFRTSEGPAHILPSCMVVDEI